MPKNKLQSIIFTILMAFVMVYGMICYNISLDMGGMKNEIFLLAFHEIIDSNGFPYRNTERSSICNYTRHLMHDRLMYVSNHEPGRNRFI